MRHYDRQYRRWTAVRANYKRARRHEFLSIWNNLFDRTADGRGSTTLLLLVLNSLKPTIRTLWLQLQMARFDSVNPPPMP